MSKPFYTTSLTLTKPIFIIILITLGMNNVILAQPSILLKDFLFNVEQQYDISIIYDSKLINTQRINSSANIKGNIEKSLSQILMPYQLKIKKIETSTYVLLAATSMFGSSPQSRVNGRVQGAIIDETGAPLQAANVYIKEAEVGAGSTTNKDGYFSLDRLPVGTYTLEISYLGYLSQDTTFTVRRGTTSHRFDFQMQPDLLSLQTVIITGVSNPTVNLASGVAITSIYQDQLNRMSSRSTADAFQNIPGFYVETSAGEVSNNLFSRGMPSEGGYQYVAIHEDGLPVYEAGGLDWLSPDHFVRIDGTTKFIEGMRGGSAGVFASNAPGGIINFVSETGSNETHGKVKLQTADFGQLRAEANIGGPIQKDLLYHTGGFYRTDNGIRQPGFIANRGGQLRGNITWLSKNGFFRANFKYLNDRNILYMPIPLRNLDPPNGLSSFDPNYGTMTSAGVQHVTFPTPYGDKNFDLSDGMHTHLGYFGTHLQYDMGSGWIIINKNRASIINKKSNALVPIFTPQSAFDYVRQYRWVGNATIPRMNYADNGEPFNFFGANGNGWVVEAGWWANENDLRNFINSFEVKKQNERYQLSGNLYVSWMENITNRHWGNVLMEVTSDQPRAIDLEFYNSNDELVQKVTHKGFTTYQSLDTYLNSTSDAFVLASYLHANYQLDTFSTIDLGFRFENLSADSNIENTFPYDLSAGDPLNFVLSEVNYGDSSYTLYQVLKNDFAWTIGFNRMLTDLASAYFRVTDSYRMPDFDNWQNQEINGGLIEGVFQAEAGYKYASPNYAFLFSGFYSYISNQVTTIATIDNEGNLIPAQTRDALSFGTEIETAIRIIKQFNLNMTATFQRAVYVVAPENELNLDQPVDRKEVKRIPNLYFMIQPMFEHKGFRAFGTMQFVGERFTDEINSDILPAYFSFNFGMSYKYKSYKVHVHAQNLTNVIGLTEGNPRLLADTSEEPIRMARPILGRSIVASVAYQF